MLSWIKRDVCNFSTGSLGKKEEERKKTLHAFSRVEQKKKKKLTRRVDERRGSLIYRQNGNKDLPVILRLKKVEILLDTIAELADREFILLTWLRRTLKHRVKTWGSARFRWKKDILLDNTEADTRFPRMKRTNRLPPRKKCASIVTHFC